ncbi:hypothetical protein LWI29_001472 [Acer saccharum]|uniref:DUF4220 domain-containing protein n=1 Tax=Acer saccharum TaxID=4024 RepID=A0AA39VQJ4_ACESA|nr:hypothetical protein LWI29_001472 [Acer saccharum]
MSQFSLLSFIIKEKPLLCSNIPKHLRLDEKLEKQWYAADMEIHKNLKTLVCEYLQKKVDDSQIGPTNSIPVDRVGPDFTEELEKSILDWLVTTDIMVLKKPYISTCGLAYLANEAGVSSSVVVVAAAAGGWVPGDWSVRVSHMRKSSMLFGLIKYGERTWVLRNASIETIRESVADDGINFSYGLKLSDFRPSTHGPYETLFVAYRLIRVYFRPRMLNVKVPSLRGSSYIASTSSEKLFKIIEFILGFSYDNLYTKAPLLYTRCGLGLRVITFFLTSSVLVLFPVVIHDKHKFSNTDVTITYILLVGAIILELYSAVLILSSDQFLVWLIEHEKFSTMKAIECFRTQKRWSNNMSQFSLLSFIMKEKPLPCPNILKHLCLVKKLEKQGYAADMEIPKNLKILIGEYLREKKKHSQIGPTNSIPMDPVGLNFTEELEKSILAWHIATDTRYELDGDDIKQHGRAFELHCRLICQISRYMFYLLVLYPNMISDGSMNEITLPSILWAARSITFTSKIEACQHFEELLTVSETYLNQRQLVNEEDNNNDIKIFLKNRLPGLLRKLSEQIVLQKNGSNGCGDRLEWGDSVPELFGIPEEDSIPVEDTNNPYSFYGMQPIQMD